MKKILLVLAFILLLPSIGLGTEAITTPITITNPSRLTVDLGRGWIARPSVNLSVLRVNLDSWDVSGGLSLGGGYGVGYKNIVSLDTFTGFTVGENDKKNSINLSLIVSLFRYGSIGVMTEFRDGSKPNMNLLVGASLPLFINN